ncbi:hypothetical protein [Neobacillus cucumis]|uniref:Uncharacterized protein n=1 Tax=Neobacillus cucumis TaxID=1740721 RepID=A0A2N5H7T5_9BACI|nr:hypothetical protein [Neobacillus cucumis]PLS01587.1 hypothetical protein CVD27_24665 [Neobacillus cucumis]
MKKAVCCFLIFMQILLNGYGVNAANKNMGKIEMPEWNTVNHLLPKYSKFTVEDMETGEKFKVQRRAGSHHADVQPLTSKDTKILKKIYGGKWSWKRRAIYVIHKNKRIAASMHGMPHGAGALQNNFPGHFCIHFYGSTTHRTNSMDLSHMLMILKASGALNDYLAKADPYQVINSYIAGFKQQDSAIVSKMSLQKIKWSPIVNKVENVGISRLEQLPPEDLTEEISLDVPAEIDWYIKGVGRQTFRGEIHMIRFSPVDAWKVDSKKFLEENHFN